MKKRPVRVLACVVALVILCSANAQQDVGELRGLKRFDPDTKLGMASDKDIKSVRLGHNVLSAARQLQSLGGDIHYISGGSRSRNVKISFFQPYQNASLEQQFKLDFNKDNGFVHHISVNYKLDSAYLDMRPVYNKIIENTVKKYGEPLSIEAVRAILNQSKDDVLLEAFVAKIEIDPSVTASVQQFFNQKIIASRTRFTESEQGRALLLSGFNECYLWPGEGYAEILSLCALRKSKVNMKGQAVEMTLYNFAIEQHIENYQEPVNDQFEIDL